MINAPDALANLVADDFDPMRAEARGMEILTEVGSSIESSKDAAGAFPAVFNFMERLDSCDIGSPGPLVHALESVGGYSSELAASIMRKPTPVTIWMLNRILNATTGSGTRNMYLKLLTRSAKHPLASLEAQAMATRFLQHQSGRG